MEYKAIDLKTLNSGAVLEMFEVEWQKLLDNVYDQNTRPDAARKVKIEVTIKPAKDRRNALSSVSVTTKLAAINPHESLIIIDVEDGKAQAYAFDPKQQTIEFGEEAMVTRFPGHREAK